MRELLNWGFKTAVSFGDDCKGYVRLLRLHGSVLVPGNSSEHSSMQESLILK